MEILVTTKVVILAMENALHKSDDIEDMNLFDTKLNRIIALTFVL